MTYTKMQTRAVNAVTDFLEKKGHTVIDFNDHFVFYIDESADEMAVAVVRYVEGGTFEDFDRPERVKHEAAAIAFLASNHLPEGRIRFDALDLVVLENGGALCRHTANVFGEEVK